MMKKYLPKVIPPGLTPSALAASNFAKRPRSDDEDDVCPPAKRAMVGKLLKRLLDGVTAGDLVNGVEEARRADGSSSGAVVKAIAASDAGAAIVCNRKGRPCGVLSVHDLTSRLSAFAARPKRAGDNRLDFVRDGVFRGLDVIGVAERRRSFSEFNAATPAERIVTLLFGYDAHALSVAVAGASRLVTRRHVLAFLAATEKGAEALAAVTVKDSNAASLLRHPVKEDDKAQRVVVDMALDQHTAVPVVDKTGTLVTDVGDADVAALLDSAGTIAEARALLQQGILDLLSHVRQDKEGAESTPSPAFAVHPDDSLAKAAAKMIKARRNRIFVVSSVLSKPVHVLSVRDIIAYLGVVAA